MINDFLRRRIGNLVLIIVVITMAGCSRRVISVEQMDNMIRDQLPIGSNKEKVKDFIDKLQIDSLKIGRETEFHKADRIALGNLDQETTDALGDRIAEFIGAVIYSSKSDGILTFDNITIAFYIDKEGRMMGTPSRRRGQISDRR